MITCDETRRLEKTEQRFLNVLYRCNVLTELSDILGYNIVNNFIDTK